MCQRVQSNVDRSTHRATEVLRSTISQGIAHFLFFTHFVLYFALWNYFKDCREFEQPTGKMSVGVFFYLGKFSDNLITENHKITTHYFALLFFFVMGYRQLLQQRHRTPHYFNFPLLPLAIVKFSCRHSKVALLSKTF